jgi:beta-mannosidase
VEGLPLRDGAFTRERMNTRRVQCTYGWDWVDRFVTMGIYRSSRLVFRKSNEIDNIYVYTSDVNKYCALVHLDVTLRDFVADKTQVNITVTSPDNDVVFEKTRVALAPSLSENIFIPSPKLWYPSGYGEQPLYTVKVWTENSCVEQKLGIRTLVVLQIDDADGSNDRQKALYIQSLDEFKDSDKNEKSACFTVLVNGIKIMCKGGNWVPCEPFPSSESAEKITRLLQLGIDAGVNMIRVWGGGIFEQDHFYNECDRLGILVTQDFLMACGTYPEEEQWFIDALKREAKYATLRLRNHVCLAFWSGDNENAVRGSENRDDFPGYRSAVYGIEPVVKSLDPRRDFFPSSPYGGDNYCSPTRGTTHNTFYLGPIFEYIKDNDMRDYHAFFDKFLARFCAEQAAMGASFASSIKKYMTDEDIYGESSYMLEYHTKNNPGLPLTLYGYTEVMAQKIFGEFKNGADRLLKMQMLHCEWTRITFELYRRNKGYAWGLIYWMFNDCWPAASGWSFVDYYACPKPAYYTFARCAKPVMASVSHEKGKTTVHVCNDSLVSVSGNGVIYKYDVVKNCKSDCVEFDFNVGENATMLAFESEKLTLGENEIFVCDISYDGKTDRAICLKNRYCDLPVIYDDYVISESENEVVVTANSFTPFVMIDLPYLLDENCFTLLAGESKTVKKIRNL